MQRYYCSCGLILRGNAAKSSHRRKWERAGMWEARRTLRRDGQHGLLTADQFREKFTVSGVDLNVVSNVVSMVADASRPAGERWALVRLAHQLVDHATTGGCHEVHDDGVWCHSPSCPGYCDYACGAVWVGLEPEQGSDDRRVTEVQVGTLRVDLREVRQ